jgi:hypothetical protein
MLRRRRWRVDVAGKRVGPNVSRCEVLGLLRSRGQVQNVKWKQNRYKKSLWNMNPTYYSFDAVAKLSNL